MRKSSTLYALKQSFQQVVPQADKRVGLPHLEFVTGLVFCFFGDSKSFSLESVRRFMISSFGIRISKGAFWERLSRKRLRNMLHQLVAELMRRLPAMAIMGEELLGKLGVKAIHLIDSSSITLWDGAGESYPGTRTNAGIKWHACFDLLAGRMTWFETTATAVHDRKCFPDVKSLTGKLIIFDLGYWDYGLLLAIDSVQGFFLSRIKSNAAIRIKEVVRGISSRQVEQPLSRLRLKRKRRRIIELLGEVVHQGESASFRMIGFWNAADKKYHWYITNLTVAASVIYPLYRIRWQVELIFKSCKRSLNLDHRLTSNNDNIIESLILSSIIASFALHLVLKLGAEEFNEEDRLSVSFQRAAHIVVLLARDFIDYLVRSSAQYAALLLDKIKLLSAELLEKNRRHRPTTLGKLHNELAAL